MLLLDGCPSRSSSRFCICTFIFLTYINDLPDNLTSNLKLIADDTSLFSRVTDPNAPESEINNDLHSINIWPYQWPYLRILLRKLQNTLPRPSLLTIYESFIKSHLHYGDIIYDQA